MHYTYTYGKIIKQNFELHLNFRGEEMYFNQEIKMIKK